MGRHWGRGQSAHVSSRRAVTFVLSLSSLLSPVWPEYNLAVGRAVVCFDVAASFSPSLFVACPSSPSFSSPVPYHDILLKNLLHSPLSPSRPASLNDHFTRATPPASRRHQKSLLFHHQLEAPGQAPHVSCNLRSKRAAPRTFPLSASLDRVDRRAGFRGALVRSRWQKREPSLWLVDTSGCLSHGHV
ncbi:hypothetical protein HDK77DRAFT_291939 [Phyllosticta capitalensis]